MKDQTFHRIKVDITITIWQKYTFPSGFNENCMFHRLFRLLLYLYKCYIDNKRTLSANIKFICVSVDRKRKKSEPLDVQINLIFTYNVHYIVFILQYWNVQKNCQIVWKNASVVLIVFNYVLWSPRLYVDDLYVHDIMSPFVTQ